MWFQKEANHGQIHPQYWQYLTISSTGKMSSLGLRNLSADLGCAPGKSSRNRPTPPAIAVVFGKSKHLRYSDNAVRAMKKSLAEVDFDRVWEAHRTVPYNKPDDRPRCDQPCCVDC